MEIAAVIPARLASERLPRKVLRLIKGKTLIRHVYERVKEAKTISNVYVATSDQEIIDEVESFGGNFIKTVQKHDCGTSRVSEAITEIEAQIVINVQADEPLISPQMLDSLSNHMINNENIEILTPVKKIEQKTDILDVNVVKVVFDKDNHAVYFSRLPIPYGGDVFYKHIGVYCFRRSFLMKYARLAESPLEEYERLEQLRFLWNGYKIAVFVTDYQAIGIDTEEDLKRVEEIIS
ncbi:MAG: 3-deoxy-manno-octulosonate cytidylyltransferase [Candidatus Omnitrophica bacterium]|nr:3-deoxy-manno-octulosonate cytidylyltransferase [Candidatus Omnitrophota bacterium]